MDKKKNSLAKALSTQRKKQNWNPPEVEAIGRKLGFKSLTTI